MEIEQMETDNSELYYSKLKDNKSHKSKNKKNSFSKINILILNSLIVIIIIISIIIHNINHQKNKKPIIEKNPNNNNNKIIKINNDNDNPDINNIILEFNINYKTNPGEKIYIYGNISDFGNWKKPKYALTSDNNEIWKRDYQINKLSPCIEFKFVCHSKNGDKWEKEENRLLCPKNLKGIEKTLDGKYKLNYMWNHFQVNFNIHYIISEPNSYMQIILPKFISEKPLKMKLEENKELLANDGNKIKSFWTISLFLRNNIKNNLNFEYRYSIFNQLDKTAITEREPSRQIHLFLNEKEYNNYKYTKNPTTSSYYFVTNSFLDVLDVNFVSDLNFDKIGTKNIFIGPYPQSENDFKLLNESGINTILNVQSDNDFIYRQINFELQLKLAKKYNIKIYRYPIEDFNQEDLFNKLKGSGDLLNELLKEKKIVYVHCTAGMSRSAATVIIYLVLYENYTVEKADNYCKKYRPVICPNYGVINKVASIYKPGYEIKGGIMYNN